MSAVLDYERIDFEWCADCLMMDANGTIGGDATIDDDERHAIKMRDLWDGWELSNNCPEECEGHFSWSQCDGCGSRLGGDRHPAVAMRQRPEVRHLLRSWSLPSTGSDEASARAGIFGELVKLAGADVQQFQGDFYHDATWITDNVTVGDELVFWYSWNHSGTNIALGSGGPHRPEHVHRVRVEWDVSEWSVRLVVCTRDDTEFLAPR